MVRSKHAQTSVEIIAFIVFALIVSIIVFSLFSDALFVSTGSKSTLDSVYVRNQVIEVSQIIASDTNVTVVLGNRHTQNITLQDVYFDNNLFFNGPLELAPLSYQTLTNSSYTGEVEPFQGSKVAVNLSFSLYGDTKLYSFRYSVLQKVSIVE